MAQKQYLTISDLRGGRNGADAPLSLPDTQCVEALNVDFWKGTIGRKRNGSAFLLLTPVSSGVTLSGYVSSLFYGTDSNGNDYPFVLDSDAKMNWFSTAHGGWTALNSGDGVASDFTQVQACRFAGRMYICYNSSVDRLHFWDYDKPTQISASGSNHGFYRVGLPKPTAAPTATDVTGGSQYALTRYYKIAWITKNDAGTIENRSELSASVTFDPPTTAGPVRVTRPPVPTMESITDWELYASTDDNLYFLIATTSASYTTTDDANNPAAYAGDAPPAVGNNIPPVSWKYIASDGNRLIGAGNWEGGPNSRVWFTPVQGASDIGDAERVPTGNYVDIDSYDGEPITGLSHYMGNVLVFKRRQIWRLIPTGDSDAPYKAVNLTRAIGCIDAHSICIAEDENGSPTIHFLSLHGPYRIGSSGIEYCGRDVEDIVATINQSATVVCHALWHQNKHQLWMWVATGTNSYPDKRLVLDTHLCRTTSGGVRGGWTVHTGPSCTAICSMNYGVYIAGAEASINTRPLIGSSASVALAMRCDEDDTWTDAGTSFQAYIKTKPYALAGLGHNCEVGQSHVIAEAGDGVQLTQIIERDFGAETRQSTCMLTATGQETRVQRQFESSEMSGAGVVQFQLGDGAETSQHWTLDALAIPYIMREER